jgi:hypothetical protein
MVRSSAGRNTGDMHVPAQIEPVAAFRYQQLLDEARLERLASLAKRRPSKSARVHTGLVLQGYLAAIAAIAGCTVERADVRP